MSRNFSKNTGTIPTDPDTPVDVIFRGGGYEKGDVADLYTWSTHLDSDWEIVLWRLSKQKKEKNV